MCKRTNVSRIEHCPPSSPRHRSPTRRSGTRLLLTWLLATCLANFAASLAIGQTLWPGNGHYYLIVDQEATWEQARLLAESMEFMGLQGHLATITSEDENTFVTTQLGDTAGAWLGGEQPPGSAEPAGGWRWITGEPWVYTNWDEGEPNDTYQGGWGKPATGQSEERLQYHHDGTHWNDLPDDPEVVTPRFIVEWDVPSVNPAVANVKGRAERLGTTNAKVTLEGRVTGASLSDLDLGAAAVTIASVLNEAGLELVAGDDLPLTLAARPGSDADGATFETPGRVRPKVRVDLNRRGEDVVSFRLVVEFAPSEKPTMCAGTPRTTELTTSFQIDADAVSVTTTQPWQCLAGDSQLRVPVP
jgi:hypothetical protein